ncbi:MAG: hypothetical protein ACI956_000240 [Nonlabens sp.]|jgi:hypothetical protein
MRIKQEVKKRQRKPYEWWIAILVLSGFVLLSFFVWSQQNKAEQQYFCDMEKRSITGKQFLSGGHSFSSGLTQSDERSFSGQYSSKCTKENLYGPAFKIDGLNEGDVIEASVWRQSDNGYGVLALQGQNDWAFYDFTATVVETQKDWERIEKTIRVPIGVRNASINIYPYNTKNSGAVFFDDLQINYYPTDVYSLAPPVEYAGANLQLKVDKKELKQLRSKRVEAFSYGNLLSGKDDLVKAKLLDDSVEVDVKIRLKGDLLDHLQSKKWSFRIVADKDQAWRGMTEFSVHNSLSRSHLNEWIYHQMLREEGILTTDYDFVKLSLNDEALGIYAYEEHFGANVIRRGQRPPGPILRFNEDGLWTYAPRGIGERPDWFYSADIGLYDSKDILNKQESYEQYVRAQDLLYAFIKGKKAPSEVFDTDRLAKALALQDVCIAHHSFIFTNVRFYFNPLTGLIEPIGYDGYTDDMRVNYGSPIMAGAYMNSRMPKDYAPTQSKNAFFHHILFNDYDFAEQYAHYLDEFTSETYIDSFLSKNMLEIRAREKFIKRDYPSYRFDPVTYFRNATTVRKVIPPLEHVSLKAYKSNNGVTLESYHQLPLQILGAGDKEMTISAPEDLILESFNETYSARRYEFPFDAKAKNIFYKTLGTDSIAIQPINRWEIPETPEAPVVKNNFQQFDFIRAEENGNIFFKPGIHRVNRSIAIPEGYRVVIPSGVTLHFEDGAALSSRSPIQAMGTFDSPIVFSSSTGRGQGLFLIDVKESSTFEHCSFYNLNAFRQNGQYTEGAVSLYNAKATFKNSSFRKIAAKDALHFVNSEYLIQDCLFQETSGDAIDADYSKGAIETSTFKNIGKDAIEISGGNAAIYTVTISNVLDSGINANLHAHVNGGTVVIKNSQAGISANDQSKVTFKKVELTEVVQGFVAYQQLANYGGAVILVADYKVEKVERLVAVDPVSEVTLKGKRIEN